MTPQKFYISATSGDLRSVRQLVKEALLTLGHYPVDQSNFALNASTIENILSATIEDCDGLIHICGMRYGAEPDPASLQPGSLRRSYTQIEYDIGRRIQKERGRQNFLMFTVICAEDFAYDPSEPEPEDKVRLQLAFRDSLRHSGEIYKSLITPNEIFSSIIRSKIPRGLSAGRNELIVDEKAALHRIESSLSKIAVSYRRSDTRWPSFMLYRELCKQWGEESIFFDLDSIPAGDDFREHLQTVMERSAVVLAIIGDRWMGRRFLKSPRINGKNDWVRSEVRVALEREVPIIPVLVDNAPMPEAEYLPVDIAELTSRQAVRIRVGRDFNHDLEGILQAIVRSSKGQFALGEG